MSLQWDGQGWGGVGRGEGARGAGMFCYIHVNRKFKKKRFNTVNVLNEVFLNV